jgi:hypothetical protein
VASQEAARGQRAQDHPEQPTAAVPRRAEPEQPTEDTRPRGHMVKRDDLNPGLAAEINKLFDKGWPPDEQTVNNFQTDDDVVFAAESEETGNYDRMRQELITAKVLSVGISEIRARVLGPVEHAEHVGSHAGHGYRVGDLVEVPRSMVLVAAWRTDTDKEGYDSRGEAATTLEPSNFAKKAYRVRPGTPYDLKLPYQTGELAWYLDKDLVTVDHVGEKGLVEQIMFTEDSLRGDVSLRLIDEAPEVGGVGTSSSSPGRRLSYCIHATGGAILCRLAKGNGTLCQESGCVSSDECVIISSDGQKFLPLMVD